MRTFNFKTEYNKLLTPEVVTYLTQIHESHDYIQPKPSVILQLHRDLYKLSGGRYTAYVWSGEE